MRLDAEDDDEVSRRPARGGSLAVALFADVAVGVGAGGDIEGDRRLLPHIAAPAAVGAGLGDLFARAAAVGAFFHADGAPEQGVLRGAHLPAAAAAVAGLERGAVFGARALT